GRNSRNGNIYGKNSQISQDTRGRLPGGADVAHAFAIADMVELVPAGLATATSERVQKDLTNVQKGHAHCCAYGHYSFGGQCRSSVRSTKGFAGPEMVQ